MINEPYVTNFFIVLTNQFLQCTVSESALGLIQLPNNKALTIFSVIKDVLSRCSLSTANCVGQAYNGVTCMSGIRIGVQALIKKELLIDCIY